jgi:hypothetical protein
MIRSCGGPPLPLSSGKQTRCVRESTATLCADEATETGRASSRREPTRQHRDVATLGGDVEPSCAGVEGEHFGVRSNRRVWVTARFDKTSDESWTGDYDDHVVTSRRLAEAARDPEVVRWLWYIAAYLVLVVGLALLAQVVSVSPSGAPGSLD